MSFLQSIWPFCLHERISWPQGREPHTHVSCLDCGKELAYDWQQMKVGERAMQGGSK